MRIAFWAETLGPRKDMLVKLSSSYMILGFPVQQNWGLGASSAVHHKPYEPISRFSVLLYCIEVPLVVQRLIPSGVRLTEKTETPSKWNHL